MTPDRLLSVIRAALDDTERIATEALSHPTRWHGMTGERIGTDDGVWRMFGECMVEGIGITIYDEGGHSAEQARHIARHDPATVLRLVAAMREIVAMYETIRIGAEAADGTVMAGAARVGLRAYEDVLRSLARGLGIDPEETP